MTAKLAAPVERYSVERIFEFPDGNQVSHEMFVTNRANNVNLACRVAELICANSTYKEIIIDAKTNLVLED